MLKDDIRKRFQQHDNQLLETEVSNLWGHFKNEVLRACDEFF